MDQVTAAQLRQSLGRIARRLERTGEPVLLKLGRKPVGVIISMKDFRERFALKQVEEERLRLVEDILADVRPSEISVQDALDEVKER